MSFQVASFSKPRMFLLLKLAILAVAVLSLYFQELKAMAGMWSEFKEYSHGYLIPLISGYLIWRKRDTLHRVTVSPDFRGILILLASLLLFILGYASFEHFTVRISFILTIFGLIYMLLGRAFSMALAFPIGYLIFMVPPPYSFMKSIAVGLKLFDAKSTYVVLSALGIPIFQDGPNLELPNMTLVVADFCTGVLSITAIIALAVLYAYLTQKSLLAKIMLIVLSVPCAILGNIGRLIITVGLAYFIGEKALGSLVHQFQGTVNFLVTLVILFLIGRLLNRMDAKHAAVVSR